ncbi:MAG: CoA ester lyase [Gammaproteobacteria bacterium]|nr:CoA ester lyase [Gammaproteobacteria bacterium]
MATDADFAKLILRRSVHFVPGGNERMFEKSLGLAADALILDLEDSVTPEGKAASRDAVCDWLRQADFGGRQKLVRINPLDSPWGEADIADVIAGSPDGLVVPKVTRASDVESVDGLVAEQERRTGLASGSVKLLLIGTETPGSAFHLPEMAAHPRVDGLTWGSEDLSAELGASAIRDASGAYLEVFSLVRSLALLAAAAAGKQPIDTIYADVRDLKGFREECRRAAAMGFTGKLTIHPDQIEIVNEMFTPSPAEVAEAEELLAAAGEHMRQGRIAFRFKGQMVDVPHLKRARRILARAGRQTED